MKLCLLPLMVISQSCVYSVCWYFVEHDGIDNGLLLHAYYVACNHQTGQSYMGETGCELMVDICGVVRLNQCV